MKKYFLSLIVFLISISNFSQEIKTPPEGKALVYFTRVSAMGFLINFKYFDNEKYLGKFSHGNYLVYECEPGKHLFWAKSENISYIEAELEAGKVYIIDFEAQMGAIKTGVKLVPFDNNPSSYKNIKKYEKKKKNILKSISDAKEYIISDDDLKEAEKDLQDLVKRSMEKYNKRKSDGELFSILPKELFYN